MENKKINKDIGRAKNIFALGFALCCAGAVLRFNPEYATTLIEALDINFIQLTEPKIKLIGSIQVLIGGAVLYYASVQFKKLKLQLDSKG